MLSMCHLQTFCRKDFCRQDKTTMQTIITYMPHYKTLSHRLDRQKAAKTLVKQYQRIFFQTL